MANKYKRKPEPLNRWVALVMALISIFMGTVFSSTLLPNQSISKEEATRLTCTYKEFTGHKKLKGGFTEIKLLFYDSSAQYIDSSCITDEIFKTIEETAPGTKFNMLVNPNNDYIVELVVNDVVILDFKTAQKSLEIDGVGFFIFGIVMYVFAIFFIAQAVLDFRKKIKRTKFKKSQKN
ncbi:MAG: hypothetical protein E7533_08455 [Ruminococcaceae bacterium]|nr:hypothetical protein [Oscillospiraceae bacterium]